MRAVRALGAALCAALALSAPARATDLTRALGDLGAAQPSTWRIAAANVAHAGPAGLDSLDAWLPHATPSWRAHAAITVSAMLLASITPSDLDRHPRLPALGKDALACADRHAAALCGPRDLEEGIGALADSTRAHFAALTALGGWGAPAAVKLTRCPQATGRVLGARALAQLRAGAQIGALQALARDSAIVIASEEEEQGRVTVAELAGQYAAAFPFSNHAPGGAGNVGAQAEEFLNAVVRAEGLDEPEWRIDNRMRDEAHTATARTWDDWWARARPVLAAMWDGADGN